MYKPTEGRVLLQAKKVYKFEVEGKKKKPVLDGEGNALYDLTDFKVVESAVANIKKGKKVVTIFRGGVPVVEMETKTHVFLVIDAEDIYAVSA